MIFLAPAFLIAAGVVAAGVIGLHFLSTREPNTDLLPTVRFVPDVPVQATTITMRFTDFWLLLLRVLLILLIGAAFAQPHLRPLRDPISRIVAVDVSRAVDKPSELVDSARAYAEEAASVIFFHDQAREVKGEVGDSLDALLDGSRWDRASRGSLSTALIQALRVASRLRDGADSLQLVIVSPFAEEERDAATSRIRALWPGRIEAVRVAGATERSGRTVERVEWADSGATDLWKAREVPDTIGGVRVNDAVMVYSFVRKWSPAVEAGGGTRVHARWIDGEPAAFESATEGGCMRSIAIPLPSKGDAILRPDFQRFLGDLEGACGEAAEMFPLGEDFMASFLGDGPMAPASLVERRVRRVTPLVPWILALALGAALAELWLRRRLASAASTEWEAESEGVRKAA